MPTHHVPPHAERPEVEVLVDGAWYYGEVRMQTQLDDGSWEFIVEWVERPGDRRLDTFSASAVRPTS